MGSARVPPILLKGVRGVEDEESIQGAAPFKKNVSTALSNRGSQVMRREKATNATRASPKAA